MQLTAENMNMEFSHRSGGNGWAIVEVLPDNYCRVVRIGKDKVDNRAYLAWVRLLKPEKPLVEPILTDIANLRLDLAHGAKRVVCTHIQYA